MEYKEIIKEKETRELITSAMEDIYSIVSTTFGPHGNTVIIPSKEDYMKFIVTKDGVSVMEQIKFKDPVKNIIANFVKDAADRTVKTAGDGTTTATILTYSFIMRCLELSTLPSKRVNEAFSNIIPQVLKLIDKESKKLTKKDIRSIVNISSNGDEVITKNILEIFNKTKNIKLIENDAQQDIITFSEGLAWESSYHSKHFVNDSKNSSIAYENAHIFVIEGKLLDLKPYSNVINSLAQANKPMIFVTEHVHENVLRTLENLYLAKKADVAVIKTPGLSEHRKNMIADLAAFTGSTVLKGDTLTQVLMKDVGIVKSISVSPMKTTFVKDESINIENYLKDLEEQRDNELYPEYVKELLDQRIKLLNGSLGVIYVGGNSNIEIKERLDRYDDAIKAIISADQEGVIPGGGTVLYKISEKLTKNYSEGSIEFKILEALKDPYHKLIDNGTVISLEDDLFKQAIIDPTKVLKTALINASSCANTILGTKGVLLTNRF